MITILRATYHGIKCDVCDWRDDSITVLEYPDYLNHPCPQCSHPLITAEQLMNVAKTLKAVEAVNVWANKWLPGWLLRWLARGSDVTVYDVDEKGRSIL